MDSLVIIATIRGTESLDSYIKNALNNNFDLSKTEFLLLTEDFVDKAPYKKVLSDNGAEGKILNQTDRDKEMEALNLKKYIDIVPKRSKAEESFGLLYLWVNKFKYGFTIDDDTFPLKEQDFFGMHISNLNFKGKMAEYESDKKFVNVMHHSFNRLGLYPRGYPYSLMGEKLSHKIVNVSKVGITQGLWTNIPDLDAVRILMDGDLNGQAKTRLEASDYGDDFTVAKSNYLTVCSMNMAFRRDMVPALYRFKMLDNPWKIDRFDDIWSGLVVKKICDSIDYKIITGKPFCQHNKGPRSTFRDLLGESPGLEPNETLYKLIDEAEMHGDTFEKVSAIAGKMRESKHPFVSYSGNHLSLWVEMLKRVS